MLLLCNLVFAQEFAGTYTTMITDSDVPPDMKDAVGSWEIVLDDEGRFTAVQNGEVAVRGTYSVSGDQMTFSDVDGKLACTEDYVVGTYTAALEGATLSFTLVNDDCAGRRIILLSHPLTKQTTVD
jgi:hypothetical protein